MQEIGLQSVFTLAGVKLSKPSTYDLQSSILCAPTITTYILFYLICLLDKNIFFFYG